MPRAKKTTETAKAETTTKKRKKVTEESADISAEEEAIEAAVEAVEQSNEEIKTNKKALPSDEIKVEKPTRKEVMTEKRRNEAARAERNAKRESTLMSWEQIRSAQHEGRIVTGTVVSIDVKNEKLVVATVQISGFKILIPADELYKNPLLDYSTVTNEASRIHREKQMLSKLLTSEIPFIITAIEGSPNSDDGYLIVGSRKAALERMEERNYIRPVRDGKPNITVDSVTEATIVTVGQHSVFANVQGVDTSIPIWQLTYRYVEDATDMYKCGQKINVRIKRIDYDEDGRVSSIAVSAKEPELDEFRPNMRNISKGALTMGTITSIRESRKTPGKTIVSLFLDSFEVPAISSFVRIDTMAEPPMTGDRVVFSVYEIKEEEGYVTGSIIRKE